MTVRVIALIITVLLTGTVTGAVFADVFRGLWWLLADRWRERRGEVMVYAPADEPETIPDPPRYGGLLTPPEGTEITPCDEVPSAPYRPEPVRADLPAQFKATVDHAPTGPFAAVPYTPEPASWAKPPPSMEELRRQYDDWDRATYGRRPAFGTDRCEADVLAAEDGAPVMMP